MPTITDNERAYYIAALNLSASEAAKMTIQDLRNSFFSTPPAPPVAAGPEAIDMLVNTAGQWHSPLGGAATYTPLNGAIAYHPVQFPIDLTITDLGVNCSTAGDGTSTMPVGLYTVGRDGVFTLLHDFGTFSLTSTGVKTITGLSKAVQKHKPYYWGIAVYGAGATVPRINGTTYTSQAYTSTGSATNTAGQNNVQGLRANWTGPGLPATQTPNATAYHGYPVISFKWV